jgi:hypothetical protein
MTVVMNDLMKLFELALVIVAAIWSELNEHTDDNYKNEFSKAEKIAIKKADTT